MKLLDRFKPKRSKVWQLDEGHVIIPAFKVGGVQYYELKDIFNTFSERGLQALQVFEEWDMRMQKKDLQDFILAFDNILRNPKEINVIEMVKITEMLKERLQFPVATLDISYKFASVRYFDESESPYRYDPEYAKIKIERWKEAGSEVDDFFIVQRLSDMLPLPQLSEDVLRRCLVAVKNANDHQLNHIQQLLSSQSMNQDSSSVH